MRNLDRPEAGTVVRSRIARLLPSLEEMRRSALPILRGTLIGGVLGVLPGNGAVLGPFASYALEKKLARDPSRFGHGAIEGVAAPEASNNAAAQTSFLPLLTLGLPANAVMALMIGAMTIHGVVPGPQVMTKEPQLFWGLVVSMWIGNLLLLLINLPLISIWVQILRIPYRVLFPIILLICCIGIYTINNAPFDIVLCRIFGLVGLALLKMEFELTPLMLGYVLGRLMEESFRRSVLISGGDWSVFVTKPISAAFLAAATLSVSVALLIPLFQRSRSTSDDMRRPFMR